MLACMVPWDHIFLWHMDDSLWQILVTAQWLPWWLIDTDLQDSKKRSTPRTICSHWAGKKDRDEVFVAVTGNNISRFLTEYLIIIHSHSSNHPKHLFLTTTTTVTVTHKLPWLTAELVCCFWMYRIYSGKNPDLGRGLSADCCPIASCCSVWKQQVSNVFREDSPRLLLDLPHSLNPHPLFK